MNAYKKNWFSVKSAIIILLTLVILGLSVYFILNRKIEEKDGLLSEDNYPSIKIMVYNGCGFSGVANNVKNYLQTKNIDVVNTRNTQRFVYDETLIVVKKNDEIDLKRLQKMTGIEHVIYATNDNFDVPFIIIAGKDYQKYFKVNNRWYN